LGSKDYSGKALPRKIALQHVHAFRQNTDIRTDRNYISLSRVNLLTRDNKKWKTLFHPFDPRG